MKKDELTEEELKLLDELYKKSKEELSQMTLKERLQYLENSKELYEKNFSEEPELITPKEILLSLKEKLTKKNKNK